MDKRKLRFVLLGVVGVIILVIGLGAAHIYNPSVPREALNELSQLFYDKDYNELDDYEKATVDSFFGSPSIQARNTQFTQWLIKWIAEPLGIFLIITAALVVSRLISNKIRPPSGPS
jgi:hypothetical protein